MGHEACNFFQIGGGGEVSWPRVPFKVDPKSPVVQTSLKGCLLSDARTNLVGESLAMENPLDDSSEAGLTASPL